MGGNINIEVRKLKLLNRITASYKYKGSKSILGYIMVNLVSNQIEFYYSNELRDGMHNGKLSVSNLILGLDNKLRLKSDKDKDIEDSRIQEIYEGQTSIFNSDRASTSIELFDKVHSYIMAVNHFGKYSYTNSKVVDKDRFYIVNRNEAFYSYPAIHLFSKKKLIAKVRMSYDIDRSFIQFMIENTNTCRDRFYHKCKVEEFPELIKTIADISW